MPGALCLNHVDIQIKHRGSSVIYGTFSNKMRRKKITGQMV